MLEGLKDWFELQRCYDVFTGNFFDENGNLETSITAKVSAHAMELDCKSYDASETLQNHTSLTVKSDGYIFDNLADYDENGHKHALTGIDRTLAIYTINEILDKIPTHASAAEKPFIVPSRYRKALPNPAHKNPNVQQYYEMS